MQIEREKIFERRVRKYLDSIGAWHIKVWGNAFQRSGVPDIIGCIKGKFFALEIKAEKGHPSELQLYEIRKIKESGGYARVLYPKEFESFKKEFEAWMTSKDY